MNKPFEGLLGNSSELKMIEYLLPLDEIEYDITELSKGVGISRLTTTEIVNKFVKWGILKLTKTTGNMTYYSINNKSPIVESIKQFNNTLIENILGDEMLYEIHDYWTRMSIVRQLPRLKAGACQ